MTDDILSPQQENKEELTAEERVNQQLASIKREDGSQMFDSVEKALDSLASAQEYIPELKRKLETKEQENDVLNTKLEKAATVEDVLNRMTSPQDEANVNAGVEEVSEDKIGELVKKEINTMREADSIAANRSQVNEALIRKFGDAEAARLALDAKATELGVGKDFLVSMADKSPTALLAIFNGGSTTSASPPTTTSVNLRLGDTPKADPIPEFSLELTSSRDQLEIMKKIKAQVHEANGVVA